MLTIFLFIFSSPIFLSFDREPAVLSFQMACAAELDKLFGRDTELALKLEKISGFAEALSTNKLQRILRVFMLAVLRFVPLLYPCTLSSVFIVFHGSILGNPAFPLPMRVMLDLYEHRDSVFATKFFHH